ncbi:MAG: hypothetical protein L0Y44_14865 [Phycisphaerales bacterium]|nr:hypothetical protein [Phycisphaerales bacterium]MCI0631923.1 hypothetical protein [Phycisphaerales bacterium]MCI0675794.1 hypothetical protein [Phycisphaerales bacterium]
MKIAVVIALTSLLAACTISDPAAPYEVHFIAGGMGSPPTHKIVVEASRAGDGIRQLDREETSRGGLRVLQDVYVVERPIRIIIEPLE